MASTVDRERTFSLKVDRFPDRHVYKQVVVAIDLRRSIFLFGHDTKTAGHLGIRKKHLTRLDIKMTGLEYVVM